MEGEPKKEEKSEHINIKVVNAEGNEVFFKIKKITPLKKLMETYCKRQGLLPNSVRFNFDGQRIRPEDTPDTLGMMDEDVIDAMVEQTGGYY